MEKRAEVAGGKLFENDPMVIEASGEAALEEIRAIADCYAVS